MKRIVLVLWSAAILAAGLAAATALQPLALRALAARRVAGARTPAVDSAVVAARIAGRCARMALADQRDCYGVELRRISAASGPRAALGVLSLLAANDSAVLIDSHNYAHTIGMAGFEATPDLARTFPQCSVSFQSGCYHGVIQAYFVHAVADDSAAVRGACAPWMNPGAYGWLRFQCTHGLGHGLTMRLDHDLPAALAQCDFLVDWWDRDTCYNGAFMENVVSATQPIQEAIMPHAMRRDPTRARFKQIDSADPAYPCTIVGERYLMACWVNQVSIIEYWTDGDIARTAAGCDRAPHAYVRWCYIGLGTDINGLAMGKAAAALGMCARTGAQWREWCYVGVAKNLIEVVAKPEPGIAFCHRIPERASKLRCNEAIGEEIDVLSAAEPVREAMCAEVEAAYVQACRYGARLRATRPPGLSAAN